MSAVIKRQWRWFNRNGQELIIKDRKDKVFGNCHLLVREDEHICMSRKTLKSAERLAKSLGYIPVDDFKKWYVAQTKAVKQYKGMTLEEGEQWRASCLKWAESLHNDNSSQKAPF